MGFYLRKSIKVGPLRFNLSKSGVGVSTGVKGLRVGTGPRGNYVHMGRKGLYYRATIPKSSSARPTPTTRPPTPAELTPESATHAPLEEIESADISQIVDSSSSELLAELSKKRKKARLWPFVASASAVVLVVGLSETWPGWLLGILLLLGLASTYFVHLRDVLSKTTVLFYELDSDMERAYGEMHNCAERLASCAVAWHIEASGAVHDKKYHAGASTLVSRNKTFIKKAEPPGLKTNVETVAIGVGRQTLYFFPDRVLVYDTNGVGAVGYQNLQVEVTHTRFIEEGNVPSDAQIVDSTWKYVNKSGGPDRRFKDNRELPICLYDSMALLSQTGLNEVVEVSQNGVADPFANAINSLAQKMPKESASASSPN